MYHYKAFYYVDLSSLWQITLGTCEMVFNLQSQVKKARNSPSNAPLMIQISRVKHISNLRYYMLVYIIVKYIFNIFLRNISNNKQFKNVYYKMQSTYLCDTVHVFSIYYSVYFSLNLLY